MKKPSKLICATLALFMISSAFVGCQSQASNAAPDSQSSQGVQNKKVVLKFANSQAPEEPITIEIAAFADRVNKRSNGSLEIQVFNNGVLGDDNEALEACARGSNILTFVDPAAMASYVPDYPIMHGPFLYKDWTEISKLAFSDWGKEMALAAEEAGIKVLDHMSTYFGTRQLISKKPVYKPEDMKGLKVRVPSVPMWIETLSSMGASTTSIPFSEVYTALSQGVADAMENPLPSIYAAKFQEACKYVSMTSHMIAPGGIEMSNKVFTSLSEEQQKILVEEAEKFAQLASARILDTEKSLVEQMKKEGVVFNDVDPEPFRQLTKVVYTKFPEWTPGLYDRVSEILAK